MRKIYPFLVELDSEAKTTRRFLEAMPADQINYSPHPRSMSAGQLAMHIATLPGTMSEWIMRDELDMPMGDPPQYPASSKDEILAAFESNLAEARDRLNGLDDGRAMDDWTFKVNGKTVMTMPRIAVVRSWMMNHLYHHRGQFGVYLRLMGAKVPASYGPSADENPLAEMAGA